MCVSFPTTVDLKSYPEVHVCRFIQSDSSGITQLHQDVCWGKKGNRCTTATRGGRERWHSSSCVVQYAVSSFAITFILIPVTLESRELLAVAGSGSAAAAAE